MSGGAALPAGKATLARALAELERNPDAPSTINLLDIAYWAPRGQIIGLTGPPGVGKSTLTSALIAEWRARGRTVGVIAVDPSSKRTGGALLGDRTRIKTDPKDDGVFVRSMAARDRLGGLASITAAAAILMRALYDIVIIETVGVGQSETDIATVADSVVLCIQPGSGDSLQFMKAGIAEIPDIVAVTKADIGDAARRAAADAEGALGLSAPVYVGWTPPVILVSAVQGDGIDDLIGKIADHVAYLAGGDGLQSRRQTQAEVWLVDAIRERYGRHGLTCAGELTLAPDMSPFRRLIELSSRFASAAAGPQEVHEI